MLNGKRDPEAEKRRIEKTGEERRPVGRPRKDSTDVIEERAAERMEYLVDKALDAIERGLKSGNETTALKAAGQFLKTFHHPTQKVDISGEVSKAEYHLHVLQAQDNLSDSDQQLLNEFLGVLREASEPDIVEAEVIEEAKDPVEGQ